MYKRFLASSLTRTNMPVVFINGARQVGKTTLAKALFGQTHDYFTLDDFQVLTWVKKDPIAFIRQAKNPLIIDEIQRCPELLLAIKTVVDEHRVPRQFILTGSVNILKLKGVSDSLAGRMVIHTLWPFSQEELLQKESGFLSSLLSGTITNNRDLSIRPDIPSAVQNGGFPQAFLAENEYQRNEWMGAYLSQIMEKDIRDLSNIEGLRDIPNILGLLAGRVGSLLNNSDLSRSLQIPNTTLKRYLAILQMAYLFCPMKPWFQNLGKKLIKSEKVFLIDTALIARVLHRDIVNDPLLSGHVLENFIALELTKQLSYKALNARLYHYRTASGEEVDFVLETPGGEIVGIEVKRGIQLTPRSVQGLIHLRDHLKDKFKIGVVLYQGSQMIPVSENIYAVPLHWLWS